MSDLCNRRIDIQFDDNRLVPILYGEYDKHLAQIERYLGVSLIPRGNIITIDGHPNDATVARTTLESLWKRLKQGRSIGSGEVDAAVRRAIQTGQDSSPLPSITIPTRTGRESILARSATQEMYLQALQKYEMVFAVGPSGTGKTYLTVAYAVNMLLSGHVDRIILSRPVVETGERLGFLPGDLRDKVDPYLRPIYDALHDMLPAEQITRRLANGEIEVAPLAFMRGRTITNAFILLDEAQNTTTLQMKMFLTRLGHGGHMAITGDITQIDLKSGEKSRTGRSHTTPPWYTRDWNHFFYSARRHTSSTRKTDRGLL